MVATDVKYWPTPELTVARGNHEPILSAYRCVRDGFFNRITQRFLLAGVSSV